MSVSALILIIIGGTLAIEGAMWAVFPAQLKDMYREMMATMSDKSLHLTGLVCVAIGVALVAFGLKLVG